MKKSYKFIFLDINNIILDEKTEIKEGDELSKKIQEKFEFTESIINNFIDNHILIDVEKEEKYSEKINNFIYPIENEIMKRYQFILVRKITKDIFNAEYDASFIIVDLEKGNDLEILKNLIEKILDFGDIKLYFLGIYKSKKNIEINIGDFFIDQEQQNDYKYEEININNEDKEQINEKIDKFIEKALFDVYNSEKENDQNFFKIEKFSKDDGENQSISGCKII